LLLPPDESRNGKKKKGYGRQRGLENGEMTLIKERETERRERERESNRS
jgi:hypothetical protein